MLEIVRVMPLASVTIRTQYFTHTFAETREQQRRLGVSMAMSTPLIFHPHLRVDLFPYITLLFFGAVSNKNGFRRVKN